MTKHNHIHYDGSYDKFILEAVSEGCKWQDSHNRPSSFEPCGWDRAKELAIHGDIEMAKKHAKKVVAIANKLVGVVRKQTVDYVPDEGHFIDVARFIEGIPECVGRFSDDKMQGIKEEINIGVNMSFPHYVTVEQIHEYGSRIAGIYIGLISSGINAKMQLYWGCGGDNDNNGFIFINIPHDFAKIASAFSSFFLRRIYFAWAEHQDDEYKNTYQVGGGYGTSLFDRGSPKKDYDVDFDISKKYREYSEDRLIAVINSALSKKKAR